jgi:3-dehydroquinate dehydratase/shikimate dehydrogenase
VTHLCVPIFVTELARARREIAAAQRAGADLVELRIDELEDEETLQILLKDRVLPAIVTCRPEWEGGRCTLDDAQRAAILSRADEHGAAFIDVELKTVQKDPQIWAQVSEERSECRLILSAHDFSGRPDRLYNIVSDLNSLPADITKIVWTARTVRDNLEAFDLLLQRPRPTIALCMGEAGIPSRILAKKFGAFLTFASLDEQSATAAGQVSIADMKNLYRWDAIGPATAVFGVVANPVRHSMSPAIHNAAFTEVAYDGIYLPLLVESSYESFKAFMESFLELEPLNLRGLSITIPHKENALRYLREKSAAIEDLAVGIGAVNTIAIHRSGASVKLEGTNTDYAAILDSITAARGISREHLAGLRVGVVGAGGTGRTAVAALAHFGAAVYLCNRTQDRAEKLAEEFNGRRGSVSAVPLEQLGSADCQVIINTTSVGMYPHMAQSPFDGMAAPWNSHTLVFDTIYNPPHTALLAQAQEAGAQTIGGVEMFVRQAAAQFQTWTGQPAPIEVMRRVLLERLGSSGH